PAELAPAAAGPRGASHAWYGLGKCLLWNGAHAAAVRCDLAEALFNIGRGDEAVRHYLAAADTGSPEIATGAPDAPARIAPGATIIDNSAVLVWRRHWASEIARTITPACRDAARCSRRELEAPYLTGDAR